MRATVTRVLVVAATTVVTVTTLTSPASAATVRYASPSGSGTSCLSNTPCSFSQAVGSAAAGDEVVLAPGNYAQLLAPVKNVNANLYIHGTPGAPAVLTSTSSDDSNPALQLTGNGLRLSDVRLTHTTSHGGYGTALSVNGDNDEISRIEVHSNGLNACAIGASGLLRDSLCTMNASASRAIVASYGLGGTHTYRMRNVTAIATGVSSPAMYLSFSSSSTADVTFDLSNVIASGDASSSDIVASQSTGATFDLQIRNSNYDTISGNATYPAPGSGTNQSAVPTYETGTYRPTPTSPTVDAGSLDADVGTSDLDGKARFSGAAIDIGAYEYQAPTTPGQPTPPNLAPDTFFTHTPKHKTRKRTPVFTFSSTEAATFLCKLDRKPARACASPYRAKAKTTGKHKLRVTAIDATGLPDPMPAVFRWRVR